MRFLLAMAVVVAALSVDLSAASGAGIEDAAAHGVQRFFFDFRATQQSPPRVFSIGADGSRARPVAPPATLMGAVSPDRKHLLYWTVTSTSTHLVVADIKGKHPRAVAPGGYQPDWSPDGSQLAFGRGQGGAGTGLFVSTPTGAHARAIPNTREGTTPRYLPDGTHVVYMRGLNPCCRMFVIGVDGSGKRPVAHGRLGGSPDVSPDGSTLVFELHHRAGTLAAPDGLATQPTAGGPVHKLAAAGKCAKSPRWSPDGKVVFFVRCQLDASGNYQFGRDSLVEINADGSHARVLLPHVVSASSLRWLAQPSAVPATTSPTAAPTSSSSAPAAPSSSSTASAQPQSGRSTTSHGTSRTAPVAVAAVLIAVTIGAYVYANRSVARGVDAG